MYKMLVPNGSLENIVHSLLLSAGMAILYKSNRCYIGGVRHPLLFPKEGDQCNLRKMRPQDATWVVSAGKAQIGWAGEDLIRESGCDNLHVVQKFPISRGGGMGVRIVVATQKSSGIDSVD